MTSLKCTALAHAQCNDGAYRFKLCYFGGLGGEFKEVLSSQVNPNNQSSPQDIAIANELSSFFSSVFKHNENIETINKCIGKARSLYLSVATDDNPRKEVVVACINFAVMSTQGYFVNLLATSNSAVTDNNFGHSFLFESGGNSWRHHHLGVFLLKAAHLVSLTISSIDLQDSRDLDSYWVVLQSRNDTKDVANKFYDKMGFEDAGLIDQLSKLQEVFEDLPDLVESGEKSVNDFIHFMWNNVQRDSLSVFSNYNGNFLPLGPFCVT